MGKENQFKVNIHAKTDNNENDQQQTDYDKKAAEQGFISRESQTKKPTKRPTKIRSKYTEQIHTWVLPRHRKWLLAEANRRCVAQTEVLAEVLDFYIKQNQPVDPSPQDNN